MGKSWFRFHGSSHQPDIIWYSPKPELANSNVPCKTKIASCTLPLVSIHWKIPFISLDVTPPVPHSGGNVTVLPLRRQRGNSALDGFGMVAWARYGAGHLGFIILTHTGPSTDHCWAKWSNNGDIRQEMVTSRGELKRLGDESCWFDGNVSYLFVYAPDLCYSATTQESNTLSALAISVMNSSDKLSPIDRYRSAPVIDAWSPKVNTQP